MKPSCSSCAHAFREEWSRDTDALRQLTEGQQRQLNRLLNSIEELDSLI